MKTIFYSAIFIFLIACSKEKSVNPAMEKHIPGTWRIEKISFQERNSWGCDDITSDYVVKKITFSENKNLIFIGDQNLTGIWSLQQTFYSDSDGSGSSVHYILNMDAGNNLNLTGTEFNVTRKRMSFQVINGDGHYWFKLRKE